VVLHKFLTLTQDHTCVGQWASSVPLWWNHQVSR